MPEMNSESKEKSGNASSTVSLREVGSTGLRTQGGTIDEEQLHNLKGLRGIQTYKEMQLNSTVSSFMFAIQMIIRQVEWGVEPHPDGNDEDVTFLEECMDDMSMDWSSFMAEVMTMLPYGFSFFEIVYKMRQDKNVLTDATGGSSSATTKYPDGRIGWRKFAPRSQDTLHKWEFDKDGGTTAFVQKAPPQYEEKSIPMQKGLLFRTTSLKGSPEGVSVLRSCYRPWYFLKRIEEIEGTGVERDLAGLPIAYVDPAILAGNSEDDRAMVASIRTLLRDVRRDMQEGIIWPLAYDDNGNETYKFELLSTGASRQFNTTEIIDRYKKELATTVMADFLVLGQDGSGSYALSQDKTSMFTTAISAWLKSIEDVLNRFAVSRLFEMNGLDAATAPSIVHKKIEKPNLAEFVTALSGLGNLGMPLFPDTALETHVRELFGLPDQSAESAEAFESKMQAELDGLAESVEIDQEQKRVSLDHAKNPPKQLEQGNKGSFPPDTKKPKKKQAGNGFAKPTKSGRSG